MANYSRSIASLSLLGTVMVASCAPVGLPWSPRLPTLPWMGPARPAVELKAPAPIAPVAPAAPVAPVAAPNAPLRLEIEAGAPDSALTVPALARPNLPPRDPWQAPEAPRIAFPQRIERWRPLVRHVLAEEWQYGTLDGPAAALNDDMILAMMQQESQGNPRAISYVGAQGLMQVMPQTFAIMMAGKASLAPAIDPDAFWDESSNIRAGIRYMALAMQNHDGNFYWSLASYNAGIGTVKRWRMAGLYAVPPVGGYTETAHYAQVIMHTYLRQRPDVKMHVPDPMPQEHVPGALELINAFRARGNR
ncbi:MAG TPA: transglycosylase SLT domain-containing protein [Chloroflexota bacterium]|nr:transglycosylase SLT domain-containing protein [Chloroflexota bacterium]